MKALFLNAWSHVTGLSPQESVVSLEMTAPVSEVVIGAPQQVSGDYRVIALFCDADLVMAEDTILVADGLIRRFSVRRSKEERGVTVEVWMEHPVAPQVKHTPGIPHRMDLAFSRQPVFEVLRERRIGLDPGHGGKDAGVKGPVNLLEKDVCLTICRGIAQMLKESGAIPVLTRENDTFMDEAGRLEALDRGQAELAVQVHASSHRDPLARQYRVFAASGHPGSYALAQHVASALEERIGITFQGVLELYDHDVHNRSARARPTARVEPICLSHYVDEANFRAPLFQKRIARAIFNGIKRYLQSYRARPG